MLESRMGTVTWVHLSDWHQRGVDFDRKMLLDALLLDLKDRSRNISEDLRRVDFVVFSGDLAFSGKREEYSLAFAEFVEPVLKACDLVDSGRPRLDRFFLVPGNHDVDRDLASLLRPDLRFFSDRSRLLGAWEASMGAASSLVRC
jgi:DNA repair exonuclease SbcCD nuclease subunit